MFYVPWNGNDTELARLLECIENNKAIILDGKMPLLVDGYCNSQSSEAENLATAKIRANRVKSELITRAEIKEENFITRNHATEGDFVTVRLTVPVKETAVTDADAEARRKAEAERLAAEKRAEQERLAEEQRKAEEARFAAEKAKAEKAAHQNKLTDMPLETPTDYHFSVCSEPFCFLTRFTVCFILPIKKLSSKVDSVSAVSKSGITISESISPKCFILDCCTWLSVS